MAQRGSHGEDDGRLEGGEIDLRAVGGGIWRRKLWIIVPTVLAALAALVFVQLSSPMFRSSALLLIENREGAAPRSGPEREVALPDQQAVASQVQLIQSRDLVRDVVSSLDLANDPEFAAPQGGLIERVLRAVGLGGASESLPANERVVENVAENLTVYPVQNSRVIGLEFVSTNADRAAKAVNGFVDAYMGIQRDAKRETNKQASQYLSDEIAKLRGGVSEAEDRVEAFRAKAGLLVGSNNTTVAAQQLGETSTQLSTSRTQQAESQAKAEMIRTVLKQGRPAEALDIANSELVRALAQQRSTLAAQIASEGRTLLPQHPRMRELAAQLNGLDIQVRSEAEKLARAFENEAKTAGARVSALSKQLDSLKTTVASANGQDVQLRALERDARSQRDLLEQMLARYREATARDNPEALLADARVISRGAAATEAYFPKKGPTIGLAAIAAFVLSLFAAAAAEVFGSRRLDDGRAAPPPSLGGIHSFGRLQTPVPTTTQAPARDAAPSSTAAISPATGLAAGPPSSVRPTVAGISETRADKPQPADEPAAVSRPATSGEFVHEATPDARALAPASDAAATVAATIGSDAVPAHGATARAASIESADAKIVSALARQLASMPITDGALRIVTTGAAPGLDISAVSAKLAATISQSGRRVVAVDAGGGAMRSGDGAQAPGLSDLLTGSATFAQAIHRDPGSRVHVVPCGSQGFESLDPAAKGRLGVVIEALGLTYDFVLLAAPSGPGAAETFASHCGAAVLVSDAGEADAQTIEAHDSLKATGIEDVVVLLVSGGEGPRGRSLVAA